MSFQLIIKPNAQREIERLPRSLQRRVIEGISRVQQNPRGQGSVKLAGMKFTYRIRVGDWRVVYEIQDESRTVYVTIVAHRSDVYR